MNLASLYDQSSHPDTTPKKPVEQKPPPDSMDAVLAAKSDAAATRPPRPVRKRKDNYFPRDAAQAAQVAKYRRTR
jgi:hypothetical protein